MICLLSYQLRHWYSFSLPLNLFEKERITFGGEQKDRILSTQISLHCYLSKSITSNKFNINNLQIHNTSAQNVQKTFLILSIVINISHHKYLFHITKRFTLLSIVLYHYPRATIHSTNTWLLLLAHSMISYSLSLLNLTTSSATF